MEAEINFLRQTFAMLESWEPRSSKGTTKPSRNKRFVDILARIGSIVNAVQIKKIKEKH